MAKKRSTKHDTEQARETPNPEPPRRDEITYTLRFQGDDVRLYAVLQRLAGKERRSLNQFIIHVLEQHASASGVWPDQPEAADQA